MSAPGPHARAGGGLIPPNHHRRLHLGHSVAIQLREPLLDAPPTPLYPGDHRLQPLRLLAERGDLAIQSHQRGAMDGRSLRRVAHRGGTLPGQRPGPLILQHPADLGQAEAGVVAHRPDVSESLQVILVIEPVGAPRAGRRPQQADVLVVADGARREADRLSRLLDPQEAVPSISRGRRRLGIG
jgi:hypothetical protein